MDEVVGAGTFRSSGDAYDSFMGRYSRPLASVFVDFAGVAPGQRALDVGCGPGALTRVLADRLGADHVAAVDPTDQFVEACRRANPGVDVRAGRAEAVPFDDASFDVAAAQLVLHFVSTPASAADEMRRVVHPGGTVAACVWDFDGGMAMLRHFWDAALTVDPAAPDEARLMSFGRSGETAELFTAAGLEDVSESVLAITAGYVDFDELWTSFLGGVGPAGAYLVSLGEPDRAAVAAALFERVGSPSGAFELSASAHAARGRRPG